MPAIDVATRDDVIGHTVAGRWTLSAPLVGAQGHGEAPVRLNVKAPSGPAPAALEQDEASRGMRLTRSRDTRRRRWCGGPSRGADGSAWPETQLAIASREAPVANGARGRHGGGGFSVACAAHSWAVCRLPCSAHPARGLLRNAADSSRSRACAGLCAEPCGPGSPWLSGWRRSAARGAGDGGSRLPSGRVAQTAGRNSPWAGRLASEALSERMLVQGHALRGDQGLGG